MESRGTGAFRRVFPNVGLDPKLKPKGVAGNGQTLETGQE